MILLAAEVTARVVHDTINVALPDSMQVQVRDTIVRVAAAHDRVHDAFDWFQLWSAAIAAIVAAFIGAVVGGWVSRRVMSEHLRNEVAAQRQNRRMIVKRRIGYCLNHAIGIIENIDGYKPEKSSQWLLWTSALFTCDLFDRISDEVVLLKDEEYQTSIEVFFHDMRITAREMIAEEERLTSVVQSYHFEDVASQTRLRETDEQLKRYRAETQKRVKAWEQNARRMLSELGDQ